MGDAAPTSDGGAPEAPGPETIDPAFRSGSLTAISLMLGFSLSFLTRWAGVPGGWTSIDVAALAVIVMGIALQVVAVTMLMSVNSLILASYNRMVRIFLAGLVLVFVGVVMAVFVDMAAGTPRLLAS